MQARVVTSLLVCGAVLAVAGCKKNTVDKMAFKSAINTNLSSRQQCVWEDAVKFPAQVTTSDEDKTKGYDALVDAGFLTRTTAEKKRFLIGSKQVTDYDVSDKGRSNWTVDQTQPGYGNFCYGHREVTTVDSFTPPDTADATQYAVVFHYDIAGLPSWASTTETKTAFPKVAADTSGTQTGTATLNKSDSGWQVTSLQPQGTNALPQ